MHDSGLLAVGTARKLTTTGSRLLSRCRAARSASPLAPCSPPSGRSPSRAAQGAGYRPDVAPGPPLSPRLPRRSQTGGRARVCAHLHREQIVRLKLEARSLARPLVQGPPAGPGAHTTGPPSLGRSRGGWTTTRPRGAADDRPALACARSPGPAPAAPAGRQLRTRRGPPPAPPAVLRDRASAGAQTRPLAAALGRRPWGRRGAPG